MINISTLDKYDRNGMYRVYDNWPKIALDSYNSDLEIVRFRKINHIVFAGMGGSGAIGDIFSAILSKTKIHVVITKGYHLPNTVDSKTLIVVISVSGNTKETMSVLESARNTKANVIAFSSGGSMEKYCKRYRIQYRKIPEFHSPRASFTVFLYSILRVLGPILSIKRSQVLESIRELEKLKLQISSKNLDKSNPSLELARWIKYIPIIYYPFGLQAAAIRFKNSLQENAKSHAMSEDVIESCHNGIVAWENTSNIQPIFLQGKDDYIKTKQIWKILEELFEFKKIDFYKISTINGGILSKLICLIYLLDYSSIYNAVLKKRDPTPVLSIDYVKSFLD